MPKKGYTHLAYEQRCQIYTLLKKGDTKSRIATAIGVAMSTISRELERSREKRDYRFKEAHQKSVTHRSKVSTKKRRLTLDVQLYVEDRIFGWNRYHHMCMISNHMSFYNFTSTLRSQFMKNRS